MSSAPSSADVPPQYRGVGVALAIGSGVLIGSSFVFKKKGLIASQSAPGQVAGEGVAYLKNAVWWIGMIMMIVGELMNAAAYAFTSAIIVTPMGALSVVICAVLSSIFLKERLTLFGWIGCFQCIMGSVIVGLNAPHEASVTTIVAFKHLFLAPGFLAFGGVVICTSLVVIFFFAPKYGKKSMLWYISVCSMIGGLSVSCTQGLGACIVTSIRGDNQFKNWFIYLLLGFVAVTLVTEIYFLNMALALFNTAMVTPTYYVIFTGCTLVTTIILYQGVKASVTQVLTVVFGFLIICSGITLLQISKVEPTHLRNLDRRTTLLLQAAREEVAQPVDDDLEKSLLRASEEPGMDALRGTFGGIGTIVRARRRQSTIGDTSSLRHSLVGRSIMRNGTVTDASAERENVAGRGVKRFQLHDPPVPSIPISPPNVLGRRRRDSHGSAIAVRGSVVAEEIEETSFKPGINDQEDVLHDFSFTSLIAPQHRPSHSASIITEEQGDELEAQLPREKSRTQNKPTSIHFPGTMLHRVPNRREEGFFSIPPISHTPPLSRSHGDRSLSSVIRPHSSEENNLEVTIERPEISRSHVSLDAFDALSQNHSNSAPERVSHSRNTPKEHSLPHSTPPDGIEEGDDASNRGIMSIRIVPSDVPTADIGPSRTHSIESSHLSLPSSDRSDGKGPLLPREET